MRPGSGGWVRPIPTLLGPGQALADGLTIVVLLLQMEGIGHMAKIAAETGSFDCDLLELRRSPRFDAAGGLAVLLVIVTLSTYKPRGVTRSEEHTSELQSLMRTSYAVFRLKKKNK